MTMRRLRGSSTLRFFRLCVRAPRMRLRSMPCDFKSATCYYSPPRSSSAMNPTELRAGLSLAGVFGLRMLGLFFILPVLAVHAANIKGGESLTLVGVALGAYGLAQGILQIPFGAAS